MIRNYVRGMFLAAAFASAPAQSIEIGSTAPAISQPQVETGTPLSLESLRGKVVLVDFWASWCSPCLKSLPLYDGLRQEFARADFEVLAVNVDEDLADAKSFLDAHAVSYPVVHDGGGLVALSYGLKAMPSSYLIDRSGKVHAQHSGFKEKDIASLRAEIQALLADPDGH